MSLILVWILVSYRLHQPIWRPQRSEALVAFGAFKGGGLTAAEAWRLIASQWLHVSFPHMLFNATMIAALGRSLERRTSIWAMLLVGIGGGAAGQLASALADPSAFVSGASQACLALSGTVLILSNRAGRDWWIAAFGVLAAVALDLFLSGHGAIKPGHAVSFLVGLAAAFSIRSLRLYAKGQAATGSSLAGGRAGEGK